MRVCRALGSLQASGHPSPALHRSCTAAPRARGLGEGPGQHLRPAWPHTLAGPPPRPPLPTVLPPLQRAWATTAPGARLRHHVRPTGPCLPHAAPADQAPASLSGNPRPLEKLAGGLSTKCSQPNLADRPPRHSVPSVAAEAFLAMGTPLVGAGVAPHSPEAGGQSLMGHVCPSRARPTGEGASGRRGGGS